MQILVWESVFRLTCDIEPDAAEYHVYRDDLANLSYASFGVCRDDLDAGGRTDTFLDDAEEPVPGAAFLNLITAEDVLGVEGSMGLGTQADRSNFGSCP